MTIIFDSLFAFVECLMFHFIPDILLLAAHAIDWIKSIFLLIFFFYIIKTTNEQAQKYKKIEVFDSQSHRHHHQRE